MSTWRIEPWDLRLLERDLLKKLRTREHFLFRSLENKIKEYASSPIEHARALGDLQKVKSEVDMWELKFHLKKCELRFMGCLVEEVGIVIFYTLYAFRKKEQDLRACHKETARERLKEFKHHGFQNLL